MTNLQLLFLSLAIPTLFLLAAFIWRFASRRASLPCPTWLGWLVELDNPFTATNRAGVIIEHLDLKLGMHVLDLGCGPGRLAIPIAQRVGSEGEVLAVDIQPGMLRRAQGKAEAAGLTNIRFLQAGAGEGKLGFHSFDRAVLVTVLGEIPNREDALREVFSALKPRGWLSITEVVMDPHFQRLSTVRELAGKIGFQERDFFGNRLSYTLNLEIPGERSAESNSAYGM